MMEHFKKELAELDCGVRKLREFGWVVGGIFALIGAWYCRRHGMFMAVGLIPGGMLMVLGGVAPESMRALYRGWMGLALILGEVVSKVLLTVLYGMVIVPVGIAARLAGNDFLKSKWKTNETTFWISRESDVVRDYRKQY